MRKLIILLIILSGGNMIHFAHAQELTVEYNFGYGDFHMKDMKNYISDNYNNVGFKNIKVTDNFPGHWIHQIKVGVEISKVHQVGLSLDFMNTAGKNAVADYSGSYDLTLRTKGIRLGEFYRLSPARWGDGIVRPYLMVTAGVVFNKSTVNENVRLYDDSYFADELSASGVNLFIEPALGCKIRLHQYLALNLNISYQYDYINIYENKGRKADIIPDWSGLRVQGGMIFYIPLRR